MWCYRPTRATGATRCGPGCRDHRAPAGSQAPRRGDQPVDHAEPDVEHERGTDGESADEVVQPVDNQHQVADQTVFIQRAVAAASKPFLLRSPCRITPRDDNTATRRTTGSSDQHLQASGRCALPSSSPGSHARSVAQKLGGGADRPSVPPPAACVIRISVAQLITRACGPACAAGMSPWRAVSVMPPPATPLADLHTRSSDRSAVTGVNGATS